VYKENQLKNEKPIKGPFISSYQKSFLVIKDTQKNSPVISKFKNWISNVICILLLHRRS